MSEENKLDKVLKQLHLGLLGLRAVNGGGGAFGSDGFGVGG